LRIIRSLSFQANKYTQANVQRREAKCKTTAGKGNHTNPQKEKLSEQQHCRGAWPVDQPGNIIGRERKSTRKENVV
jgi:hypothetical protein